MSGWAPSARVSVISREGCHLCDAALETVRRVAAETGADVEVEPDLSNAAAFLAAALVAGGEVRVPRWPAPTAQGGDVWRELLPRLGGVVGRRHDRHRPPSGRRSSPWAPSLPVTKSRC